jgi:hypothetical protein
MQKGNGMERAHICDWTELAPQIPDGFEISLRWCKLGNRVNVAVLDGRTGEQFEPEIRASKALDVFHHRFAHRGAADFRVRGKAAPSPRLPGLEADTPPANAWDDAEEWE